MKSKLPKLLIVDDERNMRESLKMAGYKADTVESAEEGLKSVTQNSYFMVITDARLDAEWMRVFA